MTTRLKVVLDDIKVATPCNADWDDMSGDERVRFCGKCEKNVYNLSAMSRLEAEALVREKEGRMCVRFFQRADGTMLTQDCPVGVRNAQWRNRVWRSFSTAAAAAGLAFGLFGGRASADLCVKGNKNGNQHPVVGHVAQGGVAMPQPPVEKLMGKIAMPTPEAKPPKKPQPPMMGEVAMPVMGDIAEPEPKPEPKPTTPTK
jgi:hypothetical protein